MRKIRVSRTMSKNEKGKSREWPAVVYLWAMGMALFGYMFARLAFDTYPHPYHWLSALLGGIAGIPLGWLWYRWRGDVF